MIVLDTNVVSEYSKPNPETKVIAWLTDLTPSTIHLTSITEAELRYGIEILPAGARREKLLKNIESLFGELFVGRILPFNSHAARSYASIAAVRRLAGRPMNHADCQIAAIAYSRGAVLATRNVRDFEGCGIEMINPWSDP